jgi:hypothetical protein
MNARARLAFVLALASALPFLAGCYTPSRSWSTPVGLARCGGISLRIDEDGHFQGGEVWTYAFIEVMSYDAGSGWRRLDGSRAAYHDEPSAAEFRRLAAAGRARVLSREGDTRRPAWTVRVPDSVPGADYEGIASCLARHREGFDALLNTPREPVSEMHGDRRPRLVGVVHWGADPYEQYLSPLSTATVPSVR